jgi:polyhydroxyalkanoate synthesis regulator phasin
MPKRKKTESPQEQYERFLKTVQDMVDAGELNPTDAEKRFEAAMEQVASKQHDGSSS